MTKLIAYKTFDYNLQHLVPAPRTREWMDNTPGSFAYYCLPLVMANSLGWYVTSDVEFEAEWDGRPDADAVKIWPLRELTDHEKRYLPIAHFGSGVLTFHLEFLFHTEEKINILTKGPANQMKHGIQALEGVIETDWLPYPFTMNWKFTAKNIRVRFNKGEPICQIVPWPSTLLGDVEPEIRSLQTNPELMERYQDYKDKRVVFNEKFLADGTIRQKYYVRGEDSIGNKSRHHITDWRVKPFQNLLSPEHNRES